MRSGTIVAVLLISLAVRAEDAEDRLVAAELLEVSAGDPSKAAEAFRALAADEKTPEAVRSRARLGLARCQRKLGQLDAAKKTLEELVNAPAQDADVLRQARSYLRELQGGRAENPEFDWIREVEKNPEIQERIFEWAMQLVGVPWDKDPPAGRQLLALGPIALPVVERILDASRDPAHRQHLALIAVRSGRIERLAVLLEPADPAQLDQRRIMMGLEELLEKLPDLPAEQQKKVLEVVASTPRSPRTDDVRAALEIAAGDTRDLPSKLRALEQSRLSQTSLLTRLVERQPAAAADVAVRALDGGLGLNTRLRYFDFILYKAQALVTSDHWKIVEELAPEAERQSERRSKIGEYVKRLEGLRRFDILAQLARGPAAKFINNWFWDRYATDKFRDAPGGWGAVLRGATRRSPEAFKSLQYLAEVNDEAAAELAGLLRAKDTEAPELVLGKPEASRGCTPSPRYAVLMAGLLESSDPAIVGFALEALVRAPPVLDVRFLPALERLLPSDPSDLRRSHALLTVLRQYVPRPETSAVAARVLFKWPEHRALLRNALKQTGPEIRRDLFREALARELTEEDASFVAFVCQQAPRDEAWGILLERLPALGTPGGRAAVLECLQVLGTAERSLEPEVLEFLRAVATDLTAGVEARYRALLFAGKSGVNWVDWAKLIADQDPLSESLSDASLSGLVVERTREEQDRVLEALRKSSKPILRKTRLDFYPRDRAEFPEVLLQALEDPDESVQYAAVDRLLELENLHNPALFSRILKSKAGRGHKRVYARIAGLADPELIEPLVALLDDRNPEVRGFALASLRTIKAALAEKEEWQAVLRGAKAIRKE